VIEEEGPVTEDLGWKRWMTDYNEGLGLVYERLVLNDYLDQLVDRYETREVLEAPLYGMAGVSGINSVRLAQRGCRVTLVDDNAERLGDVERVWGELSLSASFVHQSPVTTLPFPDGSFDLVWNWAALWYLRDPATLVREMIRTSRRLVFIAMPNRLQVGYLLRRYVLERDFVNRVDESWADIGRVRGILRGAGVSIIEEGVMDVPPWPDTVMPATEVLSRLGIRSARLNEKFSGDDWQWSTMDYYLGKRPELRQQIERYAFLDRAQWPWQIKALWAHHRYLLGGVT